MGTQAIYNTRSIWGTNYNNPEFRLEKVEQLSNAETLELWPNRNKQQDHRTWIASWLQAFHGVHWVF